MIHFSRAQFIRSAKRQSQRGFSNVQIAIGILVGVIILLGALGGFQYIVQAKVNNEIATVNDLRNATVRYATFSGPFTSTNVTAGVLQGQNFFQPAGLNVTPGTPPVITNQWGGAVTVAPGQSVNAGDSIAFTFNGVPNDVCSDIATKLDNVAQVITINGVASKTVGSGSNPGTVGTQCAAAAAANSNIIVYTLMR